MREHRNRLSAVDWRRLAVVLLLALCVRGVYLVQSAGNPTFTIPIVDAASYDERARELAFEGRFDDEFFWQASLYPALLAGIYRVTAGSIPAAHVAGALIGCATCCLVVLLGRRIFGATVGLIAGGIYAFYGPAVFFEGELLSAGLVMFFAVLLLLLLLEVRDRPNPWWLVGTGIAAALSVLLRATFLPFLAVAVAWLFLSWRRDGINAAQLGRRLACLLVGWLLLAAPSAELTRRVTGKPFLVAPSGGINLYLGNNPDFEHTVNIRPGWPWTKLRAMPQRAGVDGDVWERQAWYVDQVRRYALEQPGDFLRGLGRKTLHLVGSRELPRTVDIYLMSHWSPLLRALTARWGSFGLPFGVLLPLAVLGLVARWRQTPTPVKLFLLVFALTIVAVFVSARFRLALVPPLAVLAAAGAERLWFWLRRRQIRPLAATVAGAIPLLLAITLPGPFAQEQVDLEPELYYAVGYGHYRAGRWSEAQTELERAVVLRPGYPEAHNYLGISLYRQNRPLEAVQHFLESARLAPDFPDARNSLQVVAQEKAHCLDEAWRYAAAPDSSARDGSRAVFFANRAAALSVEPDPQVTGVRAVAFAAAGDTAQAAELAARALETLTNAPAEDFDREAELLEVLPALLPRHPTGP